MSRSPRHRARSDSHGAAATDRRHGRHASAEQQLGTAGSRDGRRRAESQRRAFAWWDADADDYLAEHGADIGDVDFVWCPEGLREQDARLLGDVAGARALEVGCGLGAVLAVAAAGGRAAGGARPVRAACCATPRDLGRSHRRSGAARPGRRRCSCRSATAAFDLACSAFGAVPFVAEPEQVMREVARVLRPGGRWVFAVNHPMRWMFSDDPGPDGLVVAQSYFDRTPYVEVDDRGAADLRGAPPHARRPGARRRRRRPGADGPRRAGVAGGPRHACGASGRRCGASSSPARRSSAAASRASFATPSPR